MSAAALALEAANPVRVALLDSAPAPLAVDYFEGRANWELGWPASAVEAAKALCRALDYPPAELRARDQDGRHLVGRRAADAVRPVAVVRFGPEPATLNAAFAVLAGRGWLPGRSIGADT